MKKYILYAIPFILCAQGAYAVHHPAKFKREVLDGLDIHSARHESPRESEAPGALGREVYQTMGAGESEDYAAYMPTSMYVRGGGGYTIGFLSGHAGSPSGAAEVRDGYSVQIGLGWNLSKIARAELDFQFNKFRFDKDTEWALEPTDLSASATEIAGIVYFDLRKRYIATGDIVRRRTVVPFVGLGVGVGRFAFNNALSDIGPGIWLEGRNGTFIAPQAAAGINFGITETLGLDLMYQYQMYVTRGFGWGPNLPNSGTSVSNIIASLRFNF
jgi:opacity protein-like surface antigen